MVTLLADVATRAISCRPAASRSRLNVGSGGSGRGIGTTSRLDVEQARTVPVGRARRTTHSGAARSAATRPRAGPGPRLSSSIRCRATPAWVATGVPATYFAGAPTFAAQQVAAQSMQIGVAEAALYPRRRQQHPGWDAADFWKVFETKSFIRAVFPASVGTS